MLGWTPAELLEATMRDFDDAARGWRDAHGGPAKPDPVSRDELDALKQKYR